MNTYKFWFGLEFHRAIMGGHWHALAVSGLFRCMFMIVFKVGLYIDCFRILRFVKFFECYQDRYFIGNSH